MRNMIVERTIVVTTTGKRIYTYTNKEYQEALKGFTVISHVASWPEDVTYVK